MSRCIDRLGGPTEATYKLGVSAPTLARWRRRGTIEKGRDIVRMARLLERGMAARWALAEKLAGE